MNAQELRKLTTEELNDKIAESKKTLRDTEFNLKIGKETDTAARKDLRRDIARMMGILNEKSAVEVKEEKEVK